MKCRLCEKFRREHEAKLDAASEAWEIKHSNEYEVWENETAENLRLFDEAKALGTESAAGLVLLEEATRGGSVIAAHLLGWIYGYGDEVERDFDKAADDYVKASAGGSWLATVHYAHLCALIGDMEACLDILGRGSEAGILPANYWLAVYRYRRVPSRGTLRAVAPLIEKAAAAGHPRAKDWLARLSLRGRLGLARIPSGLRLLREGLRTEFWTNDAPCPAVR